MTCDPPFRVLDVVAKWPGSVHDARIFREFNLWKKACGNSVPRCPVFFNS